MRRLIAILLFMLILTSVVWSQDVQVIHPKRFDRSAPLRDMVRPVTEMPEELRPDTEIPNRLRPGGEDLPPVTDPGLQTAEGPRPAGPTTLNFEGASNLDNAAVIGGRVAPPDPNMDVGPNHIFQSVNLVSEIFDKSGNSLLGPFATSDLWAGFGGPCEINNDGDPVTLYDPLADRWLVSQFVFSQSQCVAISQTPDPTGAYFRYEFSTPGNDYPKMGVMNDAYYITIRNFSGAFNIDGGAMNRAKMLAGDPSAEFIVRNLTAASGGLDLEGWLPSDIDGTSAPATGGVFIGQEFATQNNRLVQFDMVPNFANPPATVLNGPNFISVNPFDISVNAVPQPAPGGGLDVLSFFMMHRLAMRDMGTHLAIVANNTVDVGSNRAGIRWYEFRSTSGIDGPWTVHQQGTFAPNDGRHRWMGSIAMNANGDIGLMYTITSSNTFPSIRYTGRLAGDPLGQMTLAEGIAITGTGSQTGTSRWGDYSSLSVDPSDDLTFCGTHEYVQTTGSFNWWTRIASFQADNNNPNLVVTLTPVDPPINVNPPGSFDYTLRVENIGDPSAATVNAQVWTVAERIGFGETDPLFVANVSLDPGEFVQSTLTQNVPALDPANFNYIARAGNLPGNVFAEDSFPFTVSGPTTAKAGADSEIPAEWLPVASATVPEAISLQDNYPNPFNPTTKISYDLNTATHVKLTIYNMRGQEIRTLIDGIQSAGTQTVSWDGTNSTGEKVAGGIYLYRLQANGTVQTKKMTLLK